MKRGLVSFGFLFFAFLILFTSIFRIASVKYEFSDVRNDYQVLGSRDITIDYQLAFPGRILPDSAVWPIKALRDRIWLTMTTSKSKKTELKLLFADKRIGSAKILFERNKPEVAYTTLTKAEKYLEEASLGEEELRIKGIDTRDISTRIANASLKHFQVMNEILSIAPDDAKPKIIELQRYSKCAYQRAKNALLEKGMTAPDNPFDWQ